jgi:hypothetical protein
VGDQGDAGTGGDDGDGAGDDDEHAELRPRGQRRAVQERVAHAVARQHVADQPGDTAAGAQHRDAGTGAQQAADPHLGEARQRAGDEEEGVKAQPGGLAFEVQPDQQEDGDVGDEVADREVGVDARDQRPRSGADRRREREREGDLQQCHDALEGEDDDEGGDQRQGRTPGHDRE